MHFLCVHCTFGLDTSQTRTIQGSMGVLPVKPSESYIIQLSPLIPLWTGAFPLKRQVLMCWNGRWLLDGLQIEIPMRRINISKILFVVSVVESMVRSDVAKNTYREFSTWHRWLYNIKCFHMFAYQGYPMQWIMSMTRDYIIYILNLDFCYYIVYIIWIHTHMMDLYGEIHSRITTIDASFYLLEDDIGKGLSFRMLPGNPKVYLNRVEAEHYMTARGLLYIKERHHAILFLHGYLELMALGQSCIFLKGVKHSSGTMDGFSLHRP